VFVILSGCFILLKQLYGLDFIVQAALAFRGFGIRGFGIRGFGIRGFDYSRT
jgi:hypothetical protein